MTPQYLNPTNKPQAGSPRKTLLTLVNNYPKTDPALWRILKYIADLQTTLDDEITTLFEQASYSMRISDITLSVGANIANYWSRIYVPRDITGNPVYSQVKLTTIGFAVFDVPTSDITLDIQYSRDGGTTFNSLFKTFPIVPTGVESITYGDLAVGTLFDTDIIQVNCSDVGSGSTTLEVYLAGQYSGLNN